MCRVYYKEIWTEYEYNDAQVLTREAAKFQVSC